MEIKHRGYTFRQSDYNYHVRAFRDGYMVFHANVSKPMSEQELLKYADSTVDLLNDLLEQEEVRCHC